MNILKEFPDEFIDGSYVSAWKSKTGIYPILTIKDVSKCSARDQKSGETISLPVLTFFEVQTKWRMNKTAKRSCIREWGAETDAWKGQCVELTMRQTNLKRDGEEVLGVKCRPAKKQPKAQSLQKVQQVNQDGDDLSFDGKIPE
jgi:hypothetical protein